MFRNFSKYVHLGHQYKIGVLLLLISGCFPAFAMSKAIHWGLVALPIADTLLDINGHKTYRKNTPLEDVPAPVQNLYAGIINGTNSSPSSKPLHIKIAPLGRPTAVMTDRSETYAEIDPREVKEIVEQHALLTCSHKDNLSTSCACPESATVQKVLNKHRFLAHHESGHIHENHFMIGHYVLPVIAPLATHTAFSRLGVQQTFKGGLVKGLSGLFLLRLWNIYTERRADAHVPDQKELLEGGVAFCKEGLATAMKQARSAFTKSFPHWTPEQVEQRSGYFMRLHNLFDVHQHPHDRAQALERRISNLKS